MSEDISMTQSGQTGEPMNTNSDAVNGNSFGSDGNEIRVTQQFLDDFEKKILQKSYQNAMSLADKSANRAVDRATAIIEQYRNDFGVTLTNEQAQQIASKTSNAQTASNIPNPAPAQNQQAPVDRDYQSFLYYHNSRDSQTLRKCYDMQNAFGVRLMSEDPEFQSRFTEKGKYQNATEFLNAWREALTEKTLRMKNSNSEKQKEDGKQTNIGQMPLVGSKGTKSNTYDPKKRSKDYISEYLKNKGI